MYSILRDCGLVQVTAEGFSSIEEEETLEFLWFHVTFKGVFRDYGFCDLKEQKTFIHKFQPIIGCY